MRKILYVFLFMFLSACGLSPSPHESLSARLPYVVSVTPVPGVLASDPQRFEVTFSHAMALDTLHQQSVVLLPQESYADYASDAWDDLVDDVKDGDVTFVPGAITVSADQRVLSYVPQQALAAEMEYVLAVLPNVLSQERLPLNQTAAGAITRQFESRFTVMASAVSPSDHQIFPSETPGEDGSEALPPAEPFDWNRVLISEVVTDPQQDHNDSTGGNGVPFDSTPGAGTVGSTDEYVEIYNGTVDAVDLTGWRLNMVDGSDVMQDLGIGWVPFFGNGGSLDSVPAGERLVLGNPDGDMKNTILIQLLDEESLVVDEVDITDANADSTEDEAFMRDEEGIWGSDMATPGF